MDAKYSNVRPVSTSLHNTLDALHARFDFTLTDATIEATGKYTDERTALFTFTRPDMGKFQVREVCVNPPHPSKATHQNFKVTWEFVNPPAGLLKVLATL